VPMIFCGGRKLNLEKSRRSNNRFFFFPSKIATLLCLVFLVATAWGQPSLRKPNNGPVLWVVQHKNAKVYLLGFSEAKDRTWLTPTIDKAFSESTELWIETPAPSPSGSKEAKPAVSTEKLGFDAPRSLFEVLGPKLSDRTLAVAERYGVSRTTLEHLYPWRAYIVINSAYWAQKSKKVEPNEPKYTDFPDKVLVEMALSSRKPIRSEFNSSAEILAHFAGMSEEAQRERVEMLLDYYDDEENGRLKDRFDWITGKSSDRLIERMRAKQPALYRVEHVKRNEGWAVRISQMLSDGGVHFVLVGLNHVLGPDSIQKQLLKRGLKPRRIVNDKP
jgi:uncharacterized protein